MDIKQTFVVCNQNYFIKTNDDQFPNLNGTIISSSSTSTTNNTYNTTNNNNINNYFYSNYITSNKRLSTNYPTKIITKIPPSPSIPNQNNIVYSKIKIKKNNFNKKVKNAKDYKRFFSQIYQDQLNNNNNQEQSDNNNNDNVCNSQEITNDNCNNQIKNNQLNLN